MFDILPEMWAGIIGLSVILGNLGKILPPFSEIHLVPVQLSSAPSAGQYLWDTIDHHAHNCVHSFEIQALPGLTF